MAGSEGDVDLMSAYGEFALTELGDRELSERLYRGAVAAKPQVPVYRANLVDFLIATQQFDAAQKALDDLAAMNRFGSQDERLAQLRALLLAARNATPPDATEKH
jgi:hypothetical protein